MNVHITAVPLRVWVTTAGIACLLAAGVAQAQGNLPLRATEDEAELARGAVPDATPAERYNTALREAHGARKNNLAECRTVAAAERRACQAQAQEQFKADMAIANQLKANPRARPVKVEGGYPRMTSKTTIIERR